MPSPIRTLITLLALTLTACAIEPGGGADDAGAGGGQPPPAPPAESLEVAEQAIFGTPTYHASCAGAQQTQIQSALRFAQGRVNSYEFRDCLRDAFGVEAEGRMPEELWEDASTARPVDFRCDDARYGAWAGLDAARESMSFGGGYPLDIGVDDLAAVIVHEITHNHGWWHNHFYGPTWPDQVQSCMFRGQPFGARRSDMAGPSYLARAGGEGGSERTLRCGSQEAMVGIVGALSRSDGRLRRLQPICQDVDGADRVGADHTWYLALPADTYRFEDRCPAGYAMLGLDGYAGSFLERVRAVCAPLDRLQSFPGGMTTQLLSWRGLASGRYFNRHCPKRKVATGMRVRTGWLVDGAELECDDFPLDDRRAERHLPGHGGYGGANSVLHCGGAMGISGLFGQPDPNSGKLATIGARCRPVSDQGVALGDAWGWAITHTERAGRTLSQEGTTRRSDCADGEIVVGISVAASTLVGDVAVHCADAEAWLAGDDSRYVASGLLLRNGETARTFMCQTGETAVALDVRTGALVDRVGIVCAAPDAIGTLTRTSAAGGAGGTGWEEVCPQGRAMVGLRYENSGGHLRALTGRCGRQTAAGTSDFGALHLPTISGTSARDYNSDCADGQVLVGLDVATGTGYADAVRPLCGDEATLRAGQGPALVERPWIGAVVGGTTRLRCPAGEAVRGLHGRRGGWQDAVGLVCGKVTLLPGDTGRGGVGFGRSTVHPLLVPEGYTGRVRIRVNGVRWLHPVVRLRYQASPTAERFDASAGGVNGVATLDEHLSLKPGRHFIEVTGAGFGTYSVSVELL